MEKFKRKKISSEYINNIFKLINSNLLKKKLKKKKYIFILYTSSWNCSIYKKFNNKQLKIKIYHFGTNFRYTYEIKFIDN